MLLVVETTLSPITLELPEPLAERLRSLIDRLPRILELGLREWDASRQGEFEGASDVFEFLAGLPTPEEIIALRPSPSLQARVSALLEKNRQDALSAEEQEEWRHYQYLEHLVRLAKAKAFPRLGRK